MALLHLDFRLVDVSGEVYALEDHLELIEQQLTDIEKQERIALRLKQEAEGLHPDDLEWHMLSQEFYDRVNVLLPRALRGPFIVSLFAVYESAVTEIASLIQQKKKKGIALRDIRGDFLTRAKRYYRHVLDFDLCPDQKVWNRVRMIEDLRHILVHANGRIKTVNDEQRKKVSNWISQGAGISVQHGYLMFEAEFLKEAFELVGNSLHDLVARYKLWDAHGDSK